MAAFQGPVMLTQNHAGGSAWFFTSHYGLVTDFTENVLKSKKTALSPRHGSDLKKMVKNCVTLFLLASSIFITLPTPSPTVSTVNMRLPFMSVFA